MFGEANKKKKNKELTKKSRKKTFQMYICMEKKQNKTFPLPINDLMTSKEKELF